MPGLLDDALFQSLTQGAGPQIPPGLLSPRGFSPAPNEGFLTGLLGDPRNAADPRGAMWNAVATGLMRGDLASGFEGAQRAYADTEDRNFRRVANQLTLGKAAQEMAAMQAAQRRQAAILEERQRAAGARGFAALPNGRDYQGTPTAGGIPLFSLGAGGGSMGGAMGGAPSMPGAAMGAGPMPGAAPAMGGVGYGGGSQGSEVYRQLIEEANRALRYGDDKLAVEMFQRAEAFKPKFSTTSQIMRHPQTGNLVHVVQNEEGGFQVLPFNVKPDISLQDMGGRVLAIDRNAATGGEAWDKTMTPDAAASNALGWSNNELQRRRLAFEQSQPEYREVNGQLIAIPKVGAPGGVTTPRVVAGADGTPIGGTGDPKLTEVQGNATQFATRMLDATRTLEGIEGSGESPWPSTVARAGYKPEFPNWVPGGQIVGAGIAAANKAMTPESALMVRQAQDNWITANLRKESGAAIPIPELEAERAKWFPQPGEGEDVARQKAAARKVAEQAMLAQAGPGRRSVDRIISESGGNANKGAQAKPVPLPSSPKASDLRHGTMYQLPDGRTARWDSMQRRFEVQ